MDSIDQSLIYLKVTLDATSVYSVEAYASTLFAAAEESELRVERNALTFLSRLCGMMLEPDDDDGPFLPVGRWPDGRRTMLPEDVTDDELALLSIYAGVTGHPDFSARLHDVLWLRKKDVAAAVNAMRAYLVVAEDWQSKISPMQRLDRLSRATQIALGLGRSNQHATTALSAIVDFFDETLNRKDVGLAIKTAELALASGALSAEELIKRLATGLGEFAHITPSHLARRALEFQARLYQRIQDIAARRAALRKIAEAFLADADLCAREGDAHPMSRSVFLEDAIKAFRNIPNYRGDASVVEQIDKIQKELVGLHASVLNYMKPVPLPKLDHSVLVADSINAVTHVDAKESILGLAMLVESADFAAIKVSAEETLKSSLFSGLFDATYHDSDGRVVAKENAVSSRMGIEDPALWVQMMKSAGLLQMLTTQKMIRPALEWISQHHYISDKNMEWLVVDNPIVPPGRAFSIAKGLLVGFRGDFLTAASILIPQFENILRYRLKVRNIVTTKFDKDGIEDEVALDALIDLALKEGIIDNDIAFELISTLTDRFGSNLRNAHAHGLLSDGEYFSDGSVYFWGLVLRWIALPRLIEAEGKRNN
jgi:Domain of unknown function (DUF4209)